MFNIKFLPSIQNHAALRGIDMFSQPFFHRQDKNQKTKKTALGGFISFIVIILSLAYLVYLLYAYFNGENPPSITSSSTTVDGENVFDITYSPFAFAFRKNDAVITEWADAFQAEMYLSTSSGEKEEGAKPFKMVTCDTVFPNNPNFAKHMCIQINTDRPSISLISNQNSPKDEKVFTFALSQKLGGACITPPCSAIEKLMKDPSFYLELVFCYYRFDVDTNKLKPMFQREQIVLDHLLFTKDIYLVKQTIASIDDGFLLSSKRELRYLSSFTKDSSVITEGTKLSKYSSSSLLKISQIRIIDTQEVLNVEYVKISSVMAQFQSIFSTLLILGILAKMGSENKTVEEHMMLLMNYYYKQSALELDQYMEDQKKKKDNKVHNDQDSQKQSNEEEMKTIDSSTKRKNELKETLKIKNRLFSLYDPKILRHFYTQGKSITSECQDIQLKQFKVLMEKTWEMINVNALHYEIMKLKTAVQLMLSEQQNAAIEYVSRRIYIEEEQEKNHLEIMDEIDINEDLRCDKMISYYDELMKKANIDNEIDKNIKNSLIKGVFDKKKEDKQIEVKN